MVEGYLARIGGTRAVLGRVASGVKLLHLESTNSKNALSLAGHPEKFTSPFALDSTLRF